MCSPKKVCCFVCYKNFPKSIKTLRCKTCGDFKCPICHGCLCNLTIGEQRVALVMMKTYEPLLGSNYDFSVHEVIEKNIKASLGMTKKQ